MHHVAERIRKSIANQSFLLSMTGLCDVTISIGIATLSDDHNLGEIEGAVKALLQRADAALYEAKEQGESCDRFARGLDKAVRRIRRDAITWRRPANANISPSIALCFSRRWIEWNTVDRAHLLVRLIVVSYVFGAFIGIDLINLGPIEIASLGYSGSHTSQLMQSSVIIKAILLRSTW